MKKNVFRVFGIVALATVIMFSFAACDDDAGGGGPGGGGGGDSINFSIRNDNNYTITNIQVGPNNKVIYSSGPISVAPGRTHSFRVSGLQAGPTVYGHGYMFDITVSIIMDELGPQSPTWFYYIESGVTSVNYSFNGMALERL